jgi:multidrug efflux pump subunit AcrA (membrane-fusion protein)
MRLSRRIKLNNSMTTNNGNSKTTRTMTAKDTVRQPGEPRRKKKRSGFWLIGFLLLIVMACAVAFVLYRKSQAQAELQTNTERMAVTTVLTIHPQPGDAQVHLTLPGTVEALMESSVYAQVSGYIKRWFVDIGAQVKAGQLLAEIDTPVTDQQLKQAQQNVDVAQANLNLAQVTADRYNELLKTHAVSQQDTDTQNATVKVQQANLAAAQAFVSGIQQTEGFKEVKAPFDGVVTSRKIDVGDYVSATGQTAPNGATPLQTGAPTQELFRVAQTKTLRVYVNVPENYADEVVPGITATLEFASAPNEKVTGKLVRTSDAIDPGSLTLLAEIDVDNPDGKLLPGGYAQVHFDIVTSHPPMVIPGNALIFRAQGAQVGVVGADDTVRLQNIKIGRDLGTKLEVVDGLTESDSVILNPSDSLAEGQKVRVDATQQQP